MRSLVEMGERVRLRAVVNHHTVVRQDADRLARLADRYLDQVVRSLETTPDGGPAAPVDELRALLDQVRADRVDGSIALGGGDAEALADLAVVTAAHVVAHGPDGRPVRACATTGPDHLVPVRAALDAADLLDAVGLVDERVHLLGGPDASDEAAPVAVLVVGPGTSGPHVAEILRTVLPHLAEGGSVVVADATAPDVAAAVTQARSDAGHGGPTVALGDGGLRWTTARPGGAPAPIAP
jgi:hypothetical protein